MTRKYRNVPTLLDGHKFASKAEARRYAELRLLERAGDISHLELQPVYPLTFNGTRVGKYIGDFRYFDQKNGLLVIEDVKGAKTAVYRLKKRIVEAIYPGVRIVEVAA